MPLPLPQGNRFGTILGKSNGKVDTESMEIQRGALLECETAGGDHVTMRALGAVVQGSTNFPVVWVCTPEEYERAVAAGTEPDGIPWPSSALRVLGASPQREHVA